MASTAIPTTTNTVDVLDAETKSLSAPVNESAQPKVIPNDGTGVVGLDPWLEPFQDHLRERYSKAQSWIAKLKETEGGLDKFSKVRT